MPEAVAGTARRSAALLGRVDYGTCPCSGNESQSLRSALVADS
jgi:hypothetical protein